MLHSIHQKPEDKQLALLQQIHSSLNQDPLEGGKALRMVKGDKGDTGESIKGDKGDSPVKGVDYFTPEEVQAFLDAVTPKKGVHYMDGEAGNSPNPDHVANMVQSRINLKKLAQDAAQYVVPPEIEPDALIEKLQASKNQIHPKMIRGLIPLMNQIEEMGKHPVGIGGGANALIMRDSAGNQISQYVTELKFGSGITPVYSGNGLVTLTAGGSGTATETPTGTTDDSNVTFTVLNTPLYINVNGAIYYSGTGLFTSYAAGTITLSSAVGTGGFIRSIYSI